MRDNYRWGVKEFLHAYATEEAEEPFSDSVETRARKLNEAIFNQKGVLKVVEDNWEPLPQTGFVSLDQLREEMDALRTSTVHYGRYEGEKSLQALDMKQVVDELKSNAPLLYQTLDSLMTAHRSEYTRNENLYQYRKVTICFILSFSCAAKTSNYIPNLIGLYLHGNGVKRRVISTLAGFGLCVSYKTISHNIEQINEAAKERLIIMTLVEAILMLKQVRLHEIGKSTNAVVAYDNFDFHEKVKHQVLGDSGVMRSVTTGKVFLGYDIPPEGLQQSMHHPDVLLKYAKDVLSAPGAQRDDIQTDICRFFIADAMRRLYPKAIDQIWVKNPDKDFPRMPKIDALDPRQTKSYSLGAIPFSEGTIDGNYQVHKSIFVDQFGLDPEKQFQNRLYLVYGDQKTVQLIRSVKSEQRTATLDYDRRDWLLPVPSLFHLRMNFLWMIQRTHSGGPRCPEASTLFHNMNFWNRKQIPLAKAPFHLLEELILHSWDSRIIAMVYTHLQQEGVKTQWPDEVNTYLCSLTPATFLSVVEKVRLSVFTRNAWLPCDSKAGLKTPLDPSKLDQEFINHVRFLQEVETYKILKYGIKHGDIGLIGRAIDMCCIYFKGARQDNYANEMLYLKWLTTTEACDSILRKAIFSNSLVNPYCELDTWHEVDLDIELYNLSLKELLYARKNSTFDIDHLFHTSALTTDFVTGLRTSIEATVGYRPNNTHTVKSPADDIHALAYYLSRDSVNLRQDGRKCDFEAPDILSMAISTLKGAVNRFNSRIVYQADTIQEIAEDETNTEDLPADMPLVDIEVSLL
jgi:hypothetical protein